MQGFKDFNPTKDIPDLSGKVILVTGGTDITNSPFKPLLTSCQALRDSANKACAHSLHTTLRTFTSPVAMYLPLTL
jgi:hypothetical protein